MFISIIQQSCDEVLKVHILFINYLLNFIFNILFVNCISIFCVLINSTHLPIPLLLPQFSPQLCVYFLFIVFNMHWVTEYIYFLMYLHGPSVGVWLAFQCPHLLRILASRLPKSRQEWASFHSLTAFWSYGSLVNSGQVSVMYVWNGPTMSTKYCFVVQIRAPTVYYGFSIPYSTVISEP